jgi:hypothetical protein
MANLITRSILVLGVCALAVITTSRARADEYPLVNGDFWEVSGIQIKDGGDLAYANFIAGEWRKDQEFAKSKGWIKSYMVLLNYYSRKGEPDIYLITVSDRLPSGPEGEKWFQEYLAWKKETVAQLDKESGDRAEFREVGSTLLLQEQKFRN